MLRMDQVHVIRHKVLVEHQSIRQVARDLGLSRNTVVRYLTLAEPRRVALKPRPSPLHEKVDQRIRQLLNQWRPRTTRKQRPTGSRLHRQLLEEGFTVGKTTVYDCLRELRRRCLPNSVSRLRNFGKCCPTPTASWKPRVSWRDCWRHLAVMTNKPFAPP